MRPATRDEYRISLDLDSNSEPHIALIAFEQAFTDQLVYGARRQQWGFEEVPRRAGYSRAGCASPSMKLYKGFLEAPVLDENGNLLRDEQVHHPTSTTLTNLLSSARGFELRHAASCALATTPALSGLEKARQHDRWFGIRLVLVLDVARGHVRIAHFTDLSNIGGKPAAERDDDDPGGSGTSLRSPPELGRSGFRRSRWTAGPLAAGSRIVSRRWHKRSAAGAPSLYELLDVTLTILNLSILRVNFRSGRRGRHP